MVEYLMYRYKKTPIEVCNAPQGENKEGIAKAQAMVDDAQAAVEAAAAKFEEAKRIEAEAAAAEAEAKSKSDAAASKAAEADEKARIASQAEAEQQAALQELNNQEKAYNDKIAELTKKSQEGSVVQRNRAANELAQLKAEDPLPLRKAKITQAAALKKAEKAANILREAQAAAQAAADAAAQAAQEAEDRRVSAQNAANERIFSPFPFFVSTSSFVPLSSSFDAYHFRPFSFHLKVSPLPSIFQSVSIINHST